MKKTCYPSEPIEASLKKYFFQLFSDFFFIYDFQFLYENYFEKLEKSVFLFCLLLFLVVVACSCLPRVCFGSCLNQRHPHHQAVE